MSNAPSLDVPIKVPTTIPATGPLPIANGITVYQNGQKFTIPLQGSILAVLVTLVVKVWSVFNAMQVDVNEAKSSLDEMAQSIKNMEQIGSSALEATEVNAKAIAEHVKSDASSLEAAKLLDDATEKRLKALEICHSKPKACEL